MKFKEIHGILAIPILRADKRFFSLRYRKDSSEEWGIVSDVVVDEGSTIVTLRSILQVIYIYMSFFLALIIVNNCFIDVYILGAQSF